MSHHPNNQITSNSDFYPTKPDLSGFKNQKIISGVFEGKSSSDYELAWSPTSPLDFRVFSSLGNPFGGSSSISIRKGHQKSWDSGKVGLSIVDSLDDHLTDSSKIFPPSPDSKNIIFGSWIRNETPKCQKPHLPYSMEKDENSIVDQIELDSSCLLNPCQVLQQTESDIEISEDYTCVISHGLNPKTTHFYRDLVLDSVEDKKGCFGQKKESIFIIAPLNLTSPIDMLSSNEFLSFCCSCSKKLDMEKDIYMYRGCRAFCSSECRLEEIQLDEELEEKEDKEEEEAMSESSSDKDSNSVIGLSP